MTDEAKKETQESAGEEQAEMKTEAQYEEQGSQKQETKGTEDYSTESSKTAEQDKAEDDLKEAERSADVSPEEVEKMRKALAKVNRESADRRHKLNQWEDLNVDPETVKAWKEEREEAEEQKAREEGRYQELIEKARQEARTADEKANEKVNSMKTQLESYLVDQKLTEAIAAEDGIPKLLQGIAKQYVKTVQDENTGDYSTVVMDDDGLPRKNESGENMSIRELVQTFKQDGDLQYAFKAPKVSGSGNDSQASNTPAAKNPGPKPKRNEMSAKEQRAYVKEHGYEAFSKLPRK